MNKVFSAHSVSVDGYISGRTPNGQLVTTGYEVTR